MCWAALNGTKGGQHRWVSLYFCEGTKEDYENLRCSLDHGWNSITNL